MKPFEKKNAKKNLIMGHGPTNRQAEGTSGSWLTAMEPEDPGSGSAGSGADLLEAEAMLAMFCEEKSALKRNLLNLNQTIEK